MLRPIIGALIAGGAMLLGAAAVAQPAPPSSPSPAPEATYPPNDYADQANWLCWPGRDDACAADLTATAVRADGSTTVETFRANPKAPIDCFYVYPTVSRDLGIFSTMKIEPEERNVVIQQAARLRASCRLYAPMYRQFTLTALGYVMSHPQAAGQRPLSRMVSLDDVRDAWNYYLAHENHGRGVVLVGHSQGAGVLAGLLGSDIVGKPAQKQLVSAILMGAPLAVPVGKQTGGDLKSMALCTSSSQLGCLINYSSFRETSPPPDNSLFGRPRGEARAGMEAACVNPSSLAGSWGEAKAYFATSILQPTAPAWPWLKGEAIKTPFVTVPGLITAECVRTGPFHYLAIRLHPTEGSPRANDIPGDIVIAGQVAKEWGLHLIDANLFMGNLVDIVRDEGRAWVKQGR